MRAFHQWLSVSCAVVGLSVAFAPLIGAQSKPADATAQCKDGSYSQAKTERGACSGHGGVGTWYGAPKADAKAAPKDTSPAAKEAGNVKAESKAVGTTKATTGGNNTSVPTVPAKQAPKGAGVAPAGATGQCADGSYTKAKSERGACSGHGGVSVWMGDAAAKPTTASAAPPSRPTASTPPASVPAATPTRATPMPPAAATANPPATAPPTPSTATKATNIQAPPAGAPENATAQCNDGTFSMAKEHRGACSGHKGVKAWFK